MVSRQLDFANEPDVLGMVGYYIIQIVKSFKESLSKVSIKSKALDFGLVCVNLLFYITVKDTCNDSIFYNF